MAPLRRNPGSAPGRGGSAPLKGKIMKKTSVLAPLVLALAGAASSASVWAQAEDAQVQAYRFTVLGDARDRPAPPKASSPRVEERIEPGSYARYLMFLGHARSDALVQAERAGELPVRRVVSIIEPVLSDAQKHERYLGHDVAARVETTLSAREVRLDELPDVAVVTAKNAGRR
jgi:hypothetical protein